MPNLMSAAKQSVRAFYESYNDKHLDESFANFISPDLANHVMGGAFDRSGWLAFDTGLFTAFGDFSLTVFDQVAEDDRVATRYQLGGTHSGEFMGVLASGNVAFLNGTAIDRVENGLIVEHWADFDFGGFMQQLAGSEPASDDMGELANEYLRLVNAHDLDGLVALHAPGYVSHDPRGNNGAAEFRSLIGGFFAAFPDTTVTPVNVVASGDRLVTHFETTGTHENTFMGIAATGKSVHFTEIHIRRIQDGKFAERWGLIDYATFLAQLD